MSIRRPYEVKRKEYRLDKNDSQQVEIIFSIKGPTVCSNKFTDESLANALCDMLNEVYDKGRQDGVKESHEQTADSK